jgi:hypothetical protein
MNYGLSGLAMQKTSVRPSAMYKYFSRTTPIGIPFFVMSPSTCNLWSRATAAIPEDIPEDAVQPWDVQSFDELRSLSPDSPRQFILKDLIAITDQVFELKWNPHQKDACAQMRAWFLT